LVKYLHPYDKDGGVKNRYFQQGKWYILNRVKNVLFFFILDI